MGGHKRESTNFGTTLKALREAAGWSQSELAERANMNLFGIAKLEQGQREPSWATVQALAAALGVDCTAFSTKPAEASGAPEQSEQEPAAKKPRGKGKKS